MKNKFIKIAFPLITLLLGLTIWQSCSNNMDFGITPNVSWETQFSQLDEAKEQINKTYGYKLVNKKYLQKIENNNDVSKVIDLLVSEDNYLPIYGKSLTDIIPRKMSDITKVEESVIKTKGGELRFYLNKEDYKKYIPKIVQIGQEVIQVVWKKGDIVFNSYAIAEKNKGIIFDSFSYGLISIKKDSEHIGGKRLKTNSIENDNSNGSSSADGRISYSNSIRRVFYKELLMGLISIKRGEVNIEYNVGGERVNGVNKISNQYCNATSSSQKGKADAQIKCTKFQTGENGVAEFSWACYIAEDTSSIRIKFNGTEFSLEGTRRSGMDTHGSTSISPSMLN